MVMIIIMIIIIILLIGAGMSLIFQPHCICSADK